MAPVATIPHKSNGHRRYLPEDAAGSLEFDLDNKGSHVEAGALQTVNETHEPEWEGFEEEEEEDDDDDDADNDDQSSDVHSIVAEPEKKKKEKIVQPKDAEEEELERIIFGDSAGFKEGLDTFSLKGTAGAYGDSSDEEQAQDADLDHVADQDLFFFDAGPVAAPAGSVALTKAQESDDEDEDDKPAWEDSDDERLVVSLASVPQLRKLRDTAEDDLVNGKEYARRLRKQYERLYPTPDWAVHATGKANKKRRHDDDDSGEESASDMDVDEEDLSTQPLARLLKDADIISRNARGPAKRRKLQPGTIDIQRLKDVSKAGPVSNALFFHPENSTDMCKIVCNNLAIISPYIPASPVLRPQLDPPPLPRQSQSSTPKSSSYVSAHQAYTSHYDCLPSLSVRFPHLPKCASPLFPRLEHCNRESREGFARLRPPA